MRAGLIAVLLLLLAGCVLHVHLVTFYDAGGRTGPRPASTQPAATQPAGEDVVTLDWLERVLDGGGR